jgi:tRNA (guanine37-N1)-methyltransferase
MNFNFVTLFPNIINGYFSDSILKRAIEDKLITTNYYNPRDYSTNRHNKVDDTLIGGGAGMLMSMQPLADTLEDIKSKDANTKVIFLTPVAKKFNQKDAKRLAKESSITLICGRYEGFDERAIENYADEVYSIGDFILTGGELGALIMCDAIARNVPNVLGNSDSLSVESFENSLLEAPSFTKPNNYKENIVISEFLKGNHSKIASIKLKLSLFKTKFFRPDIYIKARADYEK